jgi:hypothetical protein
MDDFWKTHDADAYTGMPGFLTGGEMDELIELGKVVEIESVRESEGKFGLMFTVDVRIGDEVRSKSFSKDSIPNRDVMLEDIRDHLHGGGAPVSVVFERWGNGVGFGQPPSRDDTPWPIEEPGEEDS